MTSQDGDKNHSLASETIYSTIQALLVNCYEEDLAVLHHVATLPASAYRECQKHSCEWVDLAANITSDDVPL